MQSLICKFLARSYTIKLRQLIHIIQNFVRHYVHNIVNSIEHEFTMLSSFVEDIELYLQNYNAHTEPAHSSLAGESELSDDDSISFEMKILDDITNNLNQELKQIDQCILSPSNHQILSSTIHVTRLQYHPSSLSLHSSISLYHVPFPINKLIISSPPSNLLSSIHVFISKSTINDLLVYNLPEYILLPFEIPPEQPPIFKLHL